MSKLTKVDDFFAASSSDSDSEEPAALKRVNFERDTNSIIRNQCKQYARFLDEVSRCIAITTPKWTAKTRDNFAQPRHLQYFDTSTLVLVLHAAKNYWRGLPAKVLDVLKPDLDALVRSLVDEIHRRHIDLPVHGNEYIITDLNQLVHGVKETLGREKND